MTSSTALKLFVNRYLKYLNLQLDTLTVEKKELDRLGVLSQLGYYERPCLSVPSSFHDIPLEAMWNDLIQYEGRFADFRDPGCNDVSFSFNNSYFSSPDAEVLYAMVRRIRPSKIVEVGCGNSTRLIRQAILDAGLATKLTCIDPNPRLEIVGLADDIYQVPVETLGVPSFIQSLDANDILFIDSSHEIKSGNDVIFLYLNVLPWLKAGVLVHVHDIFLPYDYPKEWIIQKRWNFAEQYLVQVLLFFGNTFQVLWAGHFLQRTLPDFDAHFPNCHARYATSLWVKKV